MLIVARLLGLVTLVWWGMVFWVSWGFLIYPPLLTLTLLFVIPGFLWLWVIGFALTLTPGHRTAPQVIYILPPDPTWRPGRAYRLGLRLARVAHAFRKLVRPRHKLAY